MTAVVETQQQNDNRTLIVDRGYGLQQLKSVEGSLLWNDSDFKRGSIYIVEGLPACGKTFNTDSFFSQIPREELINHLNLTCDISECFREMMTEDMLRRNFSKGNIPKEAVSNENFKKDAVHMIHTNETIKMDEIRELWERSRVPIYVIIPKSHLGMKSYNHHDEKEWSPFQPFNKDDTWRISRAIVSLD